MKALSAANYLLVFISTLYLLICPYTKVEESFNIQAIHDLLYHGKNLSEYDHLDFPGVVPRTFLGPIVIAFVSYPFLLLGSMFNLNKFFMQYVARAVLGAFVLLAFEKFSCVVRKIFGEHVAVWLQLVTCTQFHFAYYLSRPLPNTFALILVLLAYSAWLENNKQLFALYSAAAVVIFRGELSILLGLIVLKESITNKNSFLVFIYWGALFGVCFLGLTVIIDSYFWARLLWPEGEVLWFNLYLNKSVLWGTFPWAWYFYSALPRALLLSIFMVPYSCWFDRRVRGLLLPALCFIIIYSFLPHKELRFIIYSVPLFNVAAARTLDILWNNRLKSSKYNLLCYFSCFSLLLNLAAAIIMVNISYYNYPGGFAIFQLHQIESETVDARIHIDSFAAQTGVTKFTELNPNWKYSKAENISSESADLINFTHLIREWSDYGEIELQYSTTHTALKYVYTYSHWRIDISEFPYFGMFMKRKVVILKLMNPFSLTIPRLESLKI